MVVGAGGTTMTVEDFAFTELTGGIGGEIWATGFVAEHPHKQSIISGTVYFTPSIIPVTAASMDMRMCFMLK